MNDPIILLAVAAAWIGFLHTLIGPDHYLPFIAMGKARNWSMPRTMLITFLCGLGHVLSSVVLGLIGVAFGLALGKLEAFEAFRGNLAAQALIIFGFTYCVWGIHRVVRNKPHGHDHPQTHQHNITPWVLFTIFVLGPCEPLIPLVMYPAAQHSFSGVLLVAGIFALATIGTMMSVVLISSWGLNFVRVRPLERYSHALAGASICASGLAIQFLGL
jgi:nickel/cobalt transporter (NicO) family protein